MGYMLCLGVCVACRQTFSFNPHRVPALVINGEREPVCRSCAERWNALHPDIARPILSGAYEPEPDHPGGFGDANDSEEEWER